MDQYDFETDNGIRTRKFGFAVDAYVTYGRDAQQYGTKDLKRLADGSAPRIPSMMVSPFRRNDKGSARVAVLQDGLLPRDINLNLR